MFTRSSFPTVTQMGLAMIAALGTWVALPTIPVLSQTSCGLTLFSGIDRDSELCYSTRSGKAGVWDRYKFKLPSDRLAVPYSRFEINYPDYFNGRFKENRIEVRLDNEPLPLRSVSWDPESYSINIELEEAVPADENLEIVFGRVKNPRFGTYYFNVRGAAPGDPLTSYIGTVILTISP